MKKSVLVLTVLVLAPMAIAVCDAGSEPATLELPVAADGSGLTAFTTAEGYLVELSALRLAIEDIELTVGGETHAGLLRGFERALLPLAYAHPGHYAGGDVTGQLLGRLVVDAFSGGEAPLGTATLLEGDYHGMNFTFRTADEEDGLAPDDPLLGHSVVLAGVARRDGDEHPFEARIDIDEGTRMVGGPFTLEAREGVEATLLFRVLMVDPSTEVDTIFDGVELADLGEPDEPILIEPGQDAHNVLRRRVQVHDHYWLEPQL